MDILRFITAGNVDDGKSTLIGRLLYDTKNIKDDVLESVSTEKGNGTNVNLAHITDGLRAERQQGITIDVAYKYFTTPQRKYIITDAPGHFQYTRNLVTGASSVDAMIILIDAQNGITEQTKRHSLVASFLKIKQVVIAINKMDVIGYDEQIFTSIKKEYLNIADKLKLHNLTFIPISALLGDNVSFPSEKMDWYKNETLMQYLENCTPVMPRNDIARFSVQCVIDTDKEGFERGIAGKLLSGKLRVGDPLTIYPELKFAIIKKIIASYDAVQEANAGDNICVYLEKNIVAKRGDMICKTYSPICPKWNNRFEGTICWLDTELPLQIGKEYILRIGATETICTITEVVYKIDISNFVKYSDEQMLEVNQFATVRIETRDKITYDPYIVLPENGRGLIIDIKTNYTSGAFVIE